MDKLRNKGYDINLLHITEVWPFPRDPVIQAIEASEKFFVVENNSLGQMAHLIQAETQKTPSDNILRFDGRPMTPNYIIKRFEEVNS